MRGVREMNEETNTDATIPSKHFIWRVATMVDAKLIWFEHFVPWAEDLIDRVDVAPLWLLNLVGTTNQAEAHRLLLDHVNAPPFEKFSEREQSDEYVACLCLRYERREISFATLLQEAGERVDGAPSSLDCEEVFEWLTTLRHTSFSPRVEEVLRASLGKRLDSVIEEVRPVYSMFQGYFQSYVAAQQSNNVPEGA
jgi:hypothetical protein